MGLFTPKWNDKSGGTALGAIRQVTNEKTLYRAALQSRHRSVREYAVNHLTDEKKLGRLASLKASEGFAENDWAAIRVLAALKLKSSENSALREQVLNECFAKAIESNVKFPEPEAVIPLITSSDALTAIMNTGKAGYAPAAALRLKDDVLMHALVEMAKDTSGFTGTTSGVIGTLVEAGRLDEEAVFHLTQSAKEEWNRNTASHYLKDPAHIQMLLDQTPSRINKYARENLMSRLVASNPAVYGEQYPDHVSAEQVTDRLPQKTLAAIAVHGSNYSYSENSPSFRAAQCLTDEMCIEAVLQNYNPNFISHRDYEKVFYRTLLSKLTSDAVIALLLQNKLGYEARNIALDYITNENDLIRLACCDSYVSLHAIQRLPDEAMGQIAAMAQNDEARKTAKYRLLKQAALSGSMDEETALEALRAFKKSDRPLVEPTLQCITTQRGILRSLSAIDKSDAVSIFEENELFASQLAKITDVDLLMAAIDDDSVSDGFRTYELIAPLRTLIAGTEKERELIDRLTRDARKLGTKKSAHALWFLEHYDQSISWGVEAGWKYVGEPYVRYQMKLLKECTEVDQANDHIRTLKALYTRCPDAVPILNGIKGTTLQKHADFHGNCASEWEDRMKDFRIDL